MEQLAGISIVGRESFSAPLLNTGSRTAALSFPRTKKEASSVSASPMVGDALSCKKLTDLSGSAEASFSHRLVVKAC